MFQRKKAKVAVLITAARVSALRVCATNCHAGLPDEEGDMVVRRNDVDWKVKACAEFFERCDEQMASASADEHEVNGQGPLPLHASSRLVATFSYIKLLL